jgi:hypothetical protein
VSRRPQIIQKNGIKSYHRDSAEDKQLTRRVNRQICFPERQLSKFHLAIDEAIKTLPVWYETDAPLKTVPGIGDVIARTLLLRVPELGNNGRHLIAALVGIAPINRDTSMMRGQRSIADGRTSVWSVLFGGSNRDPTEFTLLAPLRAAYPPWPAEEGTVGSCHMKADCETHRHRPKPYVLPATRCLNHDKAILSAWQCRKNLVHSASLNV